MHGEPSNPPLRAPATDADACRCAPPAVQGARHLQVLVEGDALYEAMLTSIASAQDRIRLESYIFAADEIGWRFADALAGRARAGVQVRLHIDAAGSRHWRAPALDAHLRRSGVQLRRFHRWSWRNPLRYNRRNHRKLLVIDEHEGYIGGFNIHRQSSRAIVGEQRWRDTHVRFGPLLARPAAGLFDAFWRGERSPEPAARVAGDAELVPNHTRACRLRLRCLYLALLGSARESIYLSTPYFVPDRKTQHALRDAARRGVDVRLLVPGRSDVPVAQWAGRAAYGPLLEDGVRIFEYAPRLLHAKTAVADGVRALVGSSNLDYRSFFLNYELNLYMDDPAACAALHEQFLLDLDEAREIQAGPWRARGLPDQAFEFLGWLARRWL